MADKVVCAEQCIYVCVLVYMFKHTAARTKTTSKQ